VPALQNKNQEIPPVFLNQEHVTMIERKKEKAMRQVERKKENTGSQGYLITAHHLYASLM